MAAELCAVLPLEPKDKQLLDLHVEPVTTSCFMCLLLLLPGFLAAFLLARLSDSWIS